MYTLLIVLHIIVCIFLILIVLLQTGRGAGIGVAFGGTSQTIFGSKGAGSFLGKLTAIMAGIFMLTSVSLAWFSSTSEESLKEKSKKQEERRKARKPLPTKPIKPAGMSIIDGGMKLQDRNLPLKKEK
jgi:preprotein translocase subunit SecG